MGILMTMVFSLPEVKGFVIDHEFTGMVFEEETVTAGTFEVEPETSLIRALLPSLNRLSYRIRYLAGLTKKWLQSGIDCAFTSLFW